MQVNGEQPFEAADVMVEMFRGGVEASELAGEWTWCDSTFGGLDTGVVLAAYQDGDRVAEIVGLFDNDSEPDARTGCRGVVVIDERGSTLLMPEGIAG